MPLLLLRRVRPLSLAAFIGMTVIGCGSDNETTQAAPAIPAEHDVFFDGYVYDGAGGTRLQAYTVEIQYRDQTVAGTVGPDGRYLVGPIPVFQDYTVNITSNGYRVFRSHNPGYTLPGGTDNLEAALAGTHTVQTHFFDAYLFPSTLQAPDLNLSVAQLTTAGTPVAAGKLRLRATTASLLADTVSETPSGVPGQLWTNDEDLQSKPVLKDISGGKVTIAGAEIVYGVTYLVSIYGVAGFQPFEGTITAGRDQTKTFALTAETSEPLLLISNTANNCHPPLSPLDVQAAVVTFDFSQDIELTPSLLPGGNAEIVDSGLSIFSNDTDVDLVRNVLKINSSSAIQERGTSVTASGKTLTISWNPSTGLQTNDPQDLISQVSYSGLSGIFVQPLGKPGNKVSLGSLGFSTVTCF